MFYQKQSFLVLGLSRSGTAAAEFLLSQGASVYLYDDMSGERIEQTLATLVEKGAKRVKKEELQDRAEVCDCLVLSPGIAIDHPLAVAFKRNGKGVVGEAELAALTLRCPVVAITGTNGKTTCVSLLTNILQAGGYEATACGNIGLPMLQCVEMTKGIAVAEISSFQLETLQSLRPHIAMILNLSEDHLNRHYTMENYVFLKGRLLKNLTETEYAVLNYDDERVRAFAQQTKAQVLYFSVRERVKGAYYENGELYFGKEKIMAAEDLYAEGIHTVQNALAVIVAAKIMGVKREQIVGVLSDFKGIKHRIELVDEVDGVRYVDDSKGTNIAATLKAIEAMKTPTVLLLGGKNKGYDYRRLFAELNDTKIVHAVLYGENRYALLRSAMECNYEKISLCTEFDSAVKIARMQAKSGETVLLSPASASFDQFASYEERGDRFVELVHAFAKEKESESNEADDEQDEAE